MWPFGENAAKKEWKSAEDVLRAAGTQGPVWPQQDLPFVFATSDGTYRVVHRGVLLPTSGGMDALLAYLRDIDAFARKRITELQLVRLLQSFGAWPTTDNHYSSSGKLGPTLERGKDELKLVLHFFVREYQYRDGVTRPAPPPTKDVEKLTLTIDRMHPAEWTNELIQVDRNVY
jgi:hypothetical protein